MIAPATSEATVPLYAGFWRRMAAWMLDSIVLVIPCLIVEAVVGQSRILYFFLTVALTCGYYAGFHSSARQATPGKVVFGIKVSSLDGERIGLAKAIGRYFASWLSTFTLMIGLLMAGVTQKKQALHDMFLETLVVNAKAERAEIVAGGATMPITGGVWAAVVMTSILIVGSVMLGALAPAYDDFKVRASVSEALALTSTMQSEVQSDLEQKRAIRPRSAHVESPSVDSISVDSSGVISVTLKANVAGGRKVTLTPLLNRSGAVESWVCTAPGIPGKLVPPACRN